MASMLGKALKMKVKRQHDLNDLQRQIGRKGFDKSQGEGSPFQKQFTKMGSPEKRQARKANDEQKNEEEVSKLKTMIGLKIKEFMRNKSL
mmetsp:Transcript_15924/g.24599  ORF Transcript_15924/g.24599 Transcript_15924/m.24599 type:complete len:90 (+) Transcript_15924:657-926(+)|eukprot:CAMPEP_0170483590 /NCGR_PEP_ID=MMETSP0208-20121228/3263_1 /TAXON_ID=197538 /ORGANISM="Strombidium inclinatum, Strain S3" /LENGTH=89 /DNA_ID=CAMNT_0010756703 /DNA_START=600 /DNA_END=869 /DNA_ORIENTATION=+